jgi:ornithine cyclodeaminase
LGRDQVRELLSMAECIRAVRPALEHTARSGATLQLNRLIMDLPGSDGACLGVMLGALNDPRCFGVKATAVFPSNFGTGFQSHQGVVTVFERDHGRPLAIVHGGEITARRTAAASAVATDALARRDSRRLTILGYGEQAVMHLEAISLVRSIEHVVVWGRDRDRAAAFALAHRRVEGPEIRIAATVAEAVAEADIVCTTTSAATPILRGADLPAGCHLNVVGSSVARFREIDGEAVACARLYVDNLSMALAEGGEIRAALADGLIDEAHIIGEIGAVLVGAREGRRHANDITLYKSLGMPVEDLAAAMHVYREAERQNVGLLVSF